jgi:hypothetical protein
MREDGVARPIRRHRRSRRAEIRFLRQCKDCSTQQFVVSAVDYDVYR